jgi:hypothetical protein
MIFTNIVMPGGMNGDELAEAAFAAKPGLKVLFTSGYPAPTVARPGRVVEEAVCGGRALSDETLMVSGPC